MPPFAGWVQDVQDLTPLAVVVLVFIVLVVYRKPLSALLHRLSGFRLQRGDWVAEGHLQARHDDPEQQAAGGAEDTPEEPQRVGGRQLVAEAKSLDRDEENAEKDKATAEREPAQLTNENDADVLETLMFEAISKRDEDEAQRVLERLQEVLPDPVERKVTRARWLALRGLQGLEPKALEQLSRLAEDEGAAPTVLYLKGLLLRHAGQASAAAQAFRESRERATDDPRRARSAVEEAKSLQTAGDTEAGIALLERLLREVTEDECTTTLWLGLADLYEMAAQHELRALALQQALEQNPTDAERLFRLAYVYSDANDDSLAPLILHLYGRALSFDEEHTWALNNSGVQFERLDLPIASVGRYERAMKRGNTLASANLANKLMGAGFAREAEELLTAAAAEPSPHENVATSTVALASARTRENERRTELAQIGQRQADFLGRFTKAAVFRSPDGFAGRWRFGNGDEVQFVLSDGAFAGEWGRGKHKRKLQATARGASGRGTFHKMGYSLFDPNKENGWEREDAAYLYLNEDDRSIEVMRLKEKSAEFERLTRVA